MTLFAESGLASNSAKLPDLKQCRSLGEVTVNTKIRGWCLIIDPSKGDCLSCHNVITNAWPDGLATSGNISPALSNFASRYRTRTELMDILYDAADKYPDTGMPPYGRHLILNPEELEMVIDFLMDI